MINFFDVETLPCNDELVIAELEKTISPPGNIKKSESIATWMDENKDAALLDLIAKTSFDGMYGRIACIAWCSGDGEILSTTPGNSEGEAIGMFYDYISFSHDNVFCGHNISGFDLPFLKHRSIILDIAPPDLLWKAMNAKIWDSCIQDTMLMWNPDKQKRVSAAKLCKVLKIESDDDIDGSMVAKTWESDPNKVIYHCVEDVRKVRQIYKRLTFNK
jgi:DNA polymerase elongation subunit (family B)